MLIPERVTNFNVYLANTNELLLCATVDLPSLSSKTDEVSGAGIMGSYESPTRGFFDSLKVTLNYRTIDRAALKLLKYDSPELDFRQSIQTYDAANGKYTSQGFRMAMKVCSPDSVELGSAEAGSKNDSKVQLEVLSLKIWFEDEEQLVIDKINYIYRIDGEDINQKQRQDLGYSY